jgi:predicted permease
MDAWPSELRFALRYLRRQGATTAVAVLALAAGIGGATTLFSVLHAVLLRPLPFPDSERIVSVHQISPRGQRMNNMSEPNFEDLREQTRSFEAMAVYSGWIQSVSGGTEPVRAGVATVSESFFDVLGVRAALGRLFGAADARAAESTAVVSHGFWQRVLSGTRDLASVRLRSGEHVHAVIGVLPPGPAFPVGTDIWVPRALTSPNTSRTAHNWRTVARLMPGVSVEQARADVSRVARRLREQYKDDTWMADADARLLRQALTGAFERPLYVLLGAVFFLLLVACANVANLLLAQATVRRGELAVRTALGAGTSDLLRQLLAETLLLALAGGGLGLLLAGVGVPALLSLEPGKLPRAEEIGLNAPVLGFALALSLLTALGLGALIAMRAARQAPLAALSASGRGGSGAPRRRALAALVASQVGATAALLVGAGLLGRSLQRLLDVDPGFRTSSVVAIDVALAAGSSPERLAARARFYDEALERLSGLPGVRQAGLVNAVPLAGGAADGTFLAIDHEIRGTQEFQRLMKDPQIAGHAQFRVASEGYFRALGIPLRRGRLFEATDTQDAPHVAVISESLARTHWQDRDPIGRHVQFGNMDGDLRLFTIVGIVGDVREAGLEAQPRPTFYASLRQRGRAASSVTLVAHVDGDPTALAAPARALLRELAPDVPPRFRTIAEIRHASLADRRFTLLLLGLFAAAALGLAALGVYGVTAYSVAARTREVGIRMALGARPREVLRLMAKEGTKATAAGALIGVLGALVLSRGLRSLLYEVEPADPPTLAGVALLLAAVTLAACAIPARRAARVDPATALRTE